jgi:dynein heavy chain
MIVLKSIRPDKICQAVQNFIIEKIGKQFVDPPTFKIQPCYKDSSNISPLIFVLSAGTDPVKDFKTFAEEEGMWAKTEMISLGQG